MGFLCMSVMLRATSSVLEQNCGAEIKLLLLLYNNLALIILSQEY